MKVNDIKEAFSKYKEIFTNIDKILILSLVFWIIYQAIELTQLWKMYFFSWSQVINDTVIIISNLIFWILSVIIWLFNSKDYKETTITEFLIYILIIAILSTVVFFSLYQFSLFDFIWSYTVWLFITLLFRVILYIKSKEMDVTDFYEYQLYVLLPIIAFWVFSVIKFDYKNYEIIIKDSTLTGSVVYFNDKYIILSNNKVIHNNDDIIFLNINK